MFAHFIYSYFSTFKTQTARLWDVNSGECKMEFRGHDHVVECAIFAPAAAIPFIREMIGLVVDVRALQQTIIHMYELIQQIV